MSWVLRESEAHLGDRLVLLVLADHAREDGTSAWPSIETIAHQSRLSERQARRCLRNLEEAGEIVETGKSRKGTHIYSFPKYISRGDNMTPPGGTSTSPGGDNMTPDPSLKQPSVELPAKRNGKVPAQRSPVQALRKQQQDRIWDALTDIFGPVTTRSKETLRGKNVGELVHAGATPDEIVKRAKTWPQHFDTATLTESALVKWWDTLGRKPLRRR